METILLGGALMLAQGPANFEDHLIRVDTDYVGNQLQQLYEDNKDQWTSINALSTEMAGRKSIVYGIDGRFDRERRERDSQIAALKKKTDSQVSYIHRKINSTNEKVEELDDNVGLGTSSARYLQKELDTLRGQIWLLISSVVVHFLITSAPRAKKFYAKIKSEIDDG